MTDAQHGLTPDDGVLVPVLQGRGFDVCVERWDAEETDWRRFDHCILRSCWDYHLRAGEFLGWLNALDQKHVGLSNPISLVRWNHHKSYLKDLERRGVPIVPTLLVSQPGATSLEGVFRAEGWDDIVFKPCISASGYRTYRVNRARAADYEDEFEALVRDSGALVQPFLAEVQASGEYSFVFFGREFSHAVLKNPGDGEFRTQEAFGGVWTAVCPTERQIGEAAMVLDVVDGPLLYARVDMVEVNGRLLLGELELIEPFLFFGADGGAAARFVNELVRLLSSSS